MDPFASMVAREVKFSEAMSSKLENWRQVSSSMICATSGSASARLWYKTWF